jgi:hypothetical protein
MYTRRCPSAPLPYFHVLAALPPTQWNVPQRRYRVICEIEGIICPLMRSQVLNSWDLESCPSALAPVQCSIYGELAYL